MTFLEQYELPIPASDLQAIQAILSQDKILCAIEPDAVLYDCLTWRRQTAHYGTQVFALFDRNVLNDVLAVARPASLGVREKCCGRSRIGAALMTFLQCSNVLIEPSMALFENPARAAEEITLFRRADEVDARIYAEIALGRRDHLPPEMLPEPRRPIPTVNFYKPISGRRNVLIAILKIAELELAQEPPLAKMEQFLRWSHKDFLFLAPVILLAAAYFTPRREGALLKNLHSPDRQKALTAIQNAVWDLQVIYQWNKRVFAQPEKNHYWLLCSRDRALRRIAKVAQCYTDEPGAGEIAARQFFQQCWGEKNGARLADLLFELHGDHENPSRMANRKPSSAYLDQLAADLEKKIHAWGGLHRR